MGRLVACVALTCSVAACGNNFNLGSNDAGVPYDADCKPGTYSGTYSCTSIDARRRSGGRAAGNGTSRSRSFRRRSHAGAHARRGAQDHDRPGPPVIEPLTRRSTVSTRQLDGATQEVFVVASGFSGKVTGKGTLTAIYNADASPPELDNGNLVPPPTLTATCTWSAKLE